MKQLILFLILFFSISLFSQELKFKGIKCGIVYSDLGNILGPANSFSSQIGYGHQYNISNFLDLNVGLEIQNYKSSTTNNSTYNYKFILRSIENPIKMCYLINRSTSLNFGFFSSFIISSSSSYEGESLTNNIFTESNNNIIKRNKKFKYGLLIEYSKKILRNIKIDLFAKTRINGGIYEYTDYPKRSLHGYLTSVGLNINYIF